MKVELLYEDSRIDVFDTDKLTPKGVFAKDAALVDYELRFDQLGDRGLWLQVHTYEADDKSKGTDEDPPAASRVRGWRFLLSEASELDAVQRITADGEEVSFRIGGELVDAVKFRSMVDLLIDDAGRKSKATCACELYDILSESPGFSASEPEKIAQAIGFGMRALNAALAFGSIGSQEYEDN